MRKMLVRFDSVLIFRIGKIIDTGNDDVSE
jgi:hypothetical protein